MSGSKHIYLHCGIVVTAYLIACAGTALGQTPEPTAELAKTVDWQRNFIDGASSSERPIRATLSCLTSTADHLVAEFHVTNLSAGPIELTGLMTDDGRFWPDVVLEVTSGETEAEWKWKSIAPKIVAGKTTTLTVAPETSSKPLFVDMDIFKMHIGKEAYGRVIFSNGKWSMFELRDLLPKKDQQVPGASSK